MDDVVKVDIIQEQQPLFEQQEQSETSIDMSRSLGSIGCISKRTISNIYECLLSCVAFASLLYITLLLFGLLIPIRLDLVFLIIGFISIFGLITTPLGIFGSSRGSYCALFLFIFLASYHLYALLMYFWFNLKAPIFIDQAGQRDSSFKGYEYLHYILSGFQALLIALSIILGACNVISLVNQISESRVIVLDNNPSD